MRVKVLEQVRCQIAKLSCECDWVLRCHVDRGVEGEHRPGLGEQDVQVAAVRDVLGDRSRAVGERCQFGISHASAPNDPLLGLGVGWLGSAS